ncbi:putative Pancreatic lipase-related protein 2 [Hypsibius exemplaris]|uniref:Pancreatic lipase-related protein 2 n=1 Tax=Hypsibius exemplaris TaxID=2072580 RepID=A0A1W0WP31_HYPEX|nr:putative Pancreatic lipase-related protein 2 [Hypsibius exemplaris]
MALLLTAFWLTVVINLTTAYTTSSSSSEVANTLTTNTSVISNTTIPVRTDANVEGLLPDILTSMMAYNAAQAARAPPPPGAAAAAPAPFSKTRWIEKEMVCYGELGCFSRVGNFSNLGKLPEMPEYVKTAFLLFTAAEQLVPEYLNYSDPSSIRSSKFRAGQPTVIVIHGFQESSKAGWISQFQATIFMKFPLANFIVTDWQIGARRPDYWRAAANTQLTAAQIAKLLSVINNVTGTSMEQVHLIGFSLGGQVAGLTSRKLVEFGLCRVGRITALDPAGPIFEGAHPDGRLDKGDGDFVQAIHGNGASLLQGAFGMVERVGHRDFYPNGGQFQPGCPEGLWDSITGSIANIGEASTTVSCNHFRATAYVLEAQNSTCRFPSFPCASYAKFLTGECFANKPTVLDIFAQPVSCNESLYSLTNADPNYCANIVRVTATVAETSPNKKGSLILKLQKPSPSHPTPTYKTLEETEFLSGKTFQDIIVGRLRLEDFANATLEYARSCRRFWPCRDNTQVNLKSFTVEEIGGQQRISCGNLTLPQGVSTNPLNSCLLNKKF